MVSNEINSADRMFFLEGVKFASQLDVAGKHDRCMRVLDYYARKALASSDIELLLILNMVCSGEIKKNVEGKNGLTWTTNYPFIVEAMRIVKDIRKEEVMSLKESKKK